MQGRLRLLLIVAFLLVIGALVLVFVVLPGTDTADTPPAQQTNIVQNPNQATNTPVPPTQPPVVFVDIVVAVQNLSRGSLIPPDAIALFPWPEQSLPVNAITDLETVIGTRARTDIYTEQPILASMIIEDLSELASVGSDLAASIPSGLVAVAVPVDRLTSVAYGIQRGDRVDIIISALFVDIDEEFQTILPNDTRLVSIAYDAESGSVTLSVGEPVQGRFESIAIPGVSLGDGRTLNSWPAVIGPQEAPRPRLATQRTIQDALVMGLGDFPLDGRLFGDVATPTPVDALPTPVPAQGATAVPATAIPRPDIVTLAVTPQDAVMLTYLIETRIPITFALRSASDTSQSPTVPVTLDYVLTTYGIQIPDKLTYSLQPAIRSIRQLVGGETIQLDTQP